MIEIAEIKNSYTIPTISRAELMSDLKEKIAEVTFEKVDGSMRVLRCTLIDKYLPELKQADPDREPRKVNESTMLVWDLENDDWRSFRINSVKRILYREEEES